MREILFVAGEVSGDSHAAAVARELVARGAPYKLTGIGGDQMRAAGVELIQHIEKLAVMGLVEVVEHIPRLWALMNQLKRRMRKGNVAAVILVDYADFNMLLAAAATSIGVPVLFYITPQVWAWRSGRIATLAKTVTKAAVILPFEEPLLRAQGVDATFVGHPLMDKVAGLPDRATSRKTLGIADDAPLLAVFPGSRGQEIERHLEPFVATAKELQRRVPGLQVVVGAAPHITLDAKQCPFPTVRSASFTLLRAADAALCKSGTTTLESAVAGCPLIVAYRTNPINYTLLKPFVQISHIGLVNVVAGKLVAPEFVQDAVQPRAMADALQPLLNPSSPERRTMVESLDRVRASLGAPGAAGRVATMAVALADRAQGRPGGRRGE